MTTPLSAIQHDDPYPYYAGLTAERPFAFDAEIGAWAAAGAEAVQAAFDAPGLRVRPSGNEVPAPIADTAAGEVFGQLVRMRDDAAAAELKSALVTVLSKTAPEAVAEAARIAAREALERGLDYRELAFGVPVAAVASLSGVPAADVRRSVALTAAFVRCIPASATADDHAAASDAAAELQPLLARAAEGDGLAARLAETAAAHRVPRRTALANAVGVLSQTYDATAGLVGATLLALGRHERGDDLRAFVEEVARHDAPIQNTRRFAHEPWTHAGQTVDTGQTVLLVLAAANRDPAVNPDPHDFDPARPQPVSFTFGSGRHGCPGRAVAVEIAAAIVAEAEAAGWTPRDLPQRHRYLPSPNARIPVLEGSGA
ncbi:cytochrome P450 [Glycomyces harbinensis]|uniref:Cytochrome P450 n=1 Tax=Glycomyces harbinensis TaxID=58114 RepID=A0A1G6ZKI1_9ACTN|nr:cytochrome P450 [Glycomyces harbinensis]SDE02913.1 Cytochrome P450 [Glycomyces harbinensis]